MPKTRWSGNQWCPLKSSKSFRLQNQSTIKLMCLRRRQSWCIKTETQLYWLNSLYRAWLYILDVKKRTDWKDSWDTRIIFKSLYWTSSKHFLSFITFLFLNTIIAINIDDCQVNTELFQAALLFYLIPLLLMVWALHTPLPATSKAAPL